MRYIHISTIFITFFSFPWESHIILQSIAFDSICGGNYGQKIYTNAGGHCFWQASLDFSAIIIVCIYLERLWLFRGCLSALFHTFICTKNNRKAKTCWTWFLPCSVSLFSRGLLMHFRGLVCVFVFFFSQLSLRINYTYGSHNYLHLFALIFITFAEEF